jgi:Zn-dependent oligopeptidase
VAVNHPPVWNRFPHQFSHIFAGGYAAGYYSYKWAEVLSADAYAAFEEAPQALAETGARFRDEILSRGGSRPAAENFKAFRGRAADRRAAAPLGHGVNRGGGCQPWLARSGNGADEVRPPPVLYSA